MESDGWSSDISDEIVDVEYTPSEETLSEESVDLTDCAEYSVNMATEAETSASMYVTCIAGSMHVLCANGNYVRAEDIAPGDRLWSPDGETDVVRNIRLRSDSVQLFEMDSVKACTMILCHGEWKHTSRGASVQDDALMLCVSPSTMICIEGRMCDVSTPYEVSVANLKDVCAATVTHAVNGCIVSVVLN